MMFVTKIQFLKAHSYSVSSCFKISVLVKQLYTKSKNVFVSVLYQDKNTLQPLNFKHDKHKVYMR